MELPEKEKRIMHLDASSIKMLEPEELFSQEVLDRLGWKGVIDLIFR